MGDDLPARNTDERSERRIYSARATPVGGSGGKSTKSPPDIMVTTPPSCETVFKAFEWQKTMPPEPTNYSGYLPLRGTLDSFKSILRENLSACPPEEKARLFKEMETYFCGPTDVCKEFRQEMIRPGTPYYELAQVWAHNDLSLRAAKLVYGAGLTLGFLGIMVGLGFKVIKGVEPISLISGILLTAYSGIQYYRNSKQPRIEEFEALTSLVEKLSDEASAPRERSPLPMILVGCLMVLNGLLAAFLAHRKKWPHLISAAVPSLTLGTGCMTIGMVDWQSLIKGMNPRESTLPAPKVR